MTIETPWAVFEDGVMEQGFTHVPNAVIFNKSLSMQARLLYQLLLSYASDDLSCSASMDQLSKDCGCKKDTVRKFRVELEEAGLIHVKHRGQGNPNLYTFPTL